jgi:hypothetical protein
LLILHEYSYEFSYTELSHLILQKKKKKKKKKINKQKKSSQPLEPKNETKTCQHELIQQSFGSKPNKKLPVQC